jgi:transposase
MVRLKVHHLREGGVKHEAICKATGISQRSVERILAGPAPTEAELRAGVCESKRGPGRPSVAASYRGQVLALLSEEGNAELPSTEVLRRSHDWGYRGGRSAMFELIKSVRPGKPREPLVRFEGLPGEFAQFDFGEVKLRFSGGSLRKVTFFAGRLKYSRFMHIVLVENQQSEALIRSLLACLEAFGGAPKEWVFDNPKTVRISKPGEPIVLHSYLRDLAADLNVLPTLCTPRTPQQKGSVENLVGFSKKNFFYARNFRDVEHLAAELSEWLQGVNFERPCDATGQVPAVLREQERPWLEQRPLRWTPESYPLRVSRVITPMATVTHEGTAYGAPPKRIGATALVLVQAKSLEIVVDREQCTHVRRDGCKVVQRLPEQRREMLTVIHGQRKQNYFRRESLLQLGPAAFDFLEQLVHRSPSGSWSPVVNDLFELLQDHGEGPMLAALAACHRLGCYDTLSVTRELRRAA